MLENWRANVDLQVIVDEKACARYMAKYAAKGEPRLKSASEILKLSVSSLQNDDQSLFGLQESNDPSCWG